MTIYMDVAEMCVKSVSPYWMMIMMMMTMMMMMMMLNNFSRSTKPK